jgi:hypothetical protein
MKMSDYTIREDQMFVSMDGSYGSGAMLFDQDALTDTQLACLEDMSDGDRYEYAFAILKGDDKTVRFLEEQNFGESWGLE